MSSSGKTKRSKVSAAWRPLKVSLMDSSLLLGGSLVKEPPNLSRCVLIQSAMEGVELVGGYLSSDLMNFNPGLGGNFEVFLRVFHQHPLLFKRSLSDTLTNIH